MRASGYDRVEGDYYVEPKWAVDRLLAVERPFTGLVHDPCCGSGNIPKQLRAAGVHAIGSDIADRGFGVTGVDFFTSASAAASIVSNPPYDRAELFVRRALTMATDRVAILARLAFLESRARQPLFRETPLARIYCSIRRISMPPGESDIVARGGTIPYAWFVWELGYSGKPTVDWF